MDNKFHVQCRIEKNGEFETAWLPVEVTEGSHVKFRNDDGSWDDGWKIVTKYALKFPSKYIAERSQDYNKTRKASDI